MTTDSSRETGSLTQWIGLAQEGCSTARKIVIHELHAFVRQMTSSQRASLPAPAKLSQSDIVQTSLIRVIENFDSFRGHTSSELRAWISQIVINEIRQANRRLRRDVRDVRREEPINEKSDQDSRVLVSTQPTPAAVAIYDEQMTRMKAAIERLPEDHRLVIQLRSMDQRPPAEIAQVMNRSPEAVTKLWYRAILKLQQSMSQDIPSR